MQQLNLFGCLLLIVAGFVPLYGVNVSKSQIGDVIIYVNETYFLCDRIICPPEAYYCSVKKVKPDPKGTQLQRDNVCYSQNNETLVESHIFESIAATDSVSLFMTAYRNGQIISNNFGSNAFYTSNNYNYFTTSGDGAVFDQAQLDNAMAYVNRITAEVGEYTSKLNEQIQQTLRDQLGSLYN